MSRKQISALEAHLGFWLRLVSNQVSLAFADRLAARSVSVGEWVVMRDLFDRKMSAPSDVAARLNLTRGAITKIADKLAAKGLAERTFDDGDGRRQTLSLTVAGRALLPALAALADANDEAFFGALDPQTRAVVLEAMKRVAEANGLAVTPID